MSLRFMRRDDWTMIHRRYLARQTQILGLSGTVSLLWMDSVDAPFAVEGPWGRVTIVDAGISWLQVAQRDAPWWLTAMFDQENRLFQLYFDITAGNRFDNPDNPCFEDRYLDLVVSPDGKIALLDRDELDAALREGQITRDQHTNAVQAGAALQAWLQAHLNALLDFVRAWQRELREEMDRGQ